MASPRALPLLLTAALSARAEGPFNQSPVVTCSCSSSGEATNPNSTGAAHPAYCCFRDLCSSTGAARLSAGALATLGPILLGHLFL